MSDYQYRSAFDSSSNVVIPTPSTTNTESSGAEATPPSSEIWSPAGSLASFICHVAHLEKSLRHETETIFFDTDSEVFGSKVYIGHGATFRVQRAEWRRKDAETRTDGEKKWGKYVAIKSVRPMNDSKENDWQDVLLEVRALLHQPLRYHPNIVRLLGFGWGPSSEGSSILPQLILEFSEIGSMETLQKSGDPLPFAVKQKLCYDVGRGLSILHACGIVHGDLTHANVLIYRSKVRVQGLPPLTAKLSDFGGSIMDITSRERHALRMTTWPFSAPESGSWLSAEGIKKTDIYSFGLFIWRTLLDCKNILGIFELDGKRTPFAETQVSKLKLSDEFLRSALFSIESYYLANNLPEACFKLVRYALQNTIQTDPSLRSLPKAQCALMGFNLEMIPQYFEAVQLKNQREDSGRRSQAPGTHGLSQDSLGAQLGRLGHDYDAQNNIPGYRPQLDQPDAGDFFFDPLRLKELLSWSQQERIVKEFERSASIRSHNSTTELKWWMAAFYLFQCYLVEFGVTYDPAKACHWLAKAAEEEDSGGINYLAQAWIWRMSDSLDVQCPASMETLKLYMKLSIFRGHRTCLVDGRNIISHTQDPASRAQWTSVLNDGEYYLGTLASGLGMPYFAPRKLRRPYSFNDLNVLDSQIKDELGEDYQYCLKDYQPSEGNGDDGKNPDAGRERKTFESIYVNHVGHGLLHLAASYGRPEALRHMIQKYKVNINVEDSTAYETPLVCACRSRQFDCVRVLLEAGASPRITRSGVETPLYWLCTFQEKKMREVAKMLIDAGAIVDEGGMNTMRPDVRAIWADWEHLFSVPVTPLGRAVIMNNIIAVDILLSHGADPLLRPNRNMSEPGTSALEIAALLNLPDILEKLLLHVDSKSDTKFTLFDECTMLQIAHQKKTIPADTTSLQSRLVRHGPQYKSALFRTLEILRNHSAKQLYQETPSPFIKGASLCYETMLGNTDVVESLLRLGHPANGSSEHRPLKEAIITNNSTIFQILVDMGADIFVKDELDNGTSLSLLQVLASRPDTTRPGAYIEEYLIRNGVPVDPNDGTRPALAYALLNHNLQLADLLLANGADINKTYRAEMDGPWITVLGELVQKHTEGNLKSIEYILQLMGNQKHQQQKEERVDPYSLSGQLENLRLIPGSTPVTKLAVAPDFIVDKTHNFSIIQVLADLPLQSISSTAQISSRIIDTVLKTFHTPDQINYVHEVYGTALCMAVVSSNISMISALLERNADCSIPADVNSFDEAHKSRLGHNMAGTPAIPKVLSVLMVTRLSETGAAQAAINSNLSVEYLEGLRDKFTVIEMIVEAEAMRIDVQDWTTQMPRLKAFIENQIPEKIRAAMGLTFVPGQWNYPVNLSKLPEMETKPWKEGDEMDGEQATVTMLKYMRG
ncbi:hypothetical protein B7463_g2525, partial [Scytalidium lignicola]